MKDADSAVADRLREARTAKQLTQAEWADLLGEKKHVIVDVERKRARPSPELLAAAVGRAGLSAAWLVHGAGEPYERVAGDEAESKLRALREASLEVGGLDLEESVKRAAHEWLFAIKTRDVRRLAKLAEAPISEAEVELLRHYRAAPRDSQKLIVATAAAVAGAPAAMATKAQHSTTFHGEVGAVHTVHEGSMSVTHKSPAKRVRNPPRG